jgi:hypothetical protein
MAIIDGLLTFDQAAVITTSRASTNTVDLLNNRDLGVDPEIKLLVQVTSTFTAAGGATLTTQFQGSNDNSAWTTYAEGQAQPVASMTAGAHLLDVNLPRPPAGAPIPRYLRVNYVVATGPFTAGAVTATLVRDRGDAVQYAAGINIVTYGGLNAEVQAYC